MVLRVGNVALLGWLCCLGCSGGQTGDAGATGGGALHCTTPEPETSVADVEATGFPLGPWLETTFGTEQRLEWDLRVRPPRSFFEQRGLAYPALDPTTAAHVVLSPSGRATLLLATSDPANAGNPFCVDQARVELNIELEFPDFGETQTSSGTISVDASGTTVQQSLSLGELGEDCGPMSGKLSDPALVYCNLRAGGAPMLAYPQDGIIGTNQCAAPETWPPAPVESTTGLTAAAFFQHPELGQPIPLSCRKPDGSLEPTLTASISLTVADRVCEPFYTQASARVQLSTGEAFEGLNANVGDKKLPCSSDPVRWDPVTEPEPVVPVCPSFLVHFENPTPDSELLMQVVLHDDGSQTVQVDYFDPRYQGGSQTPAPYADCSGRLEIPAAP